MMSNGSPRHVVSSHLIRVPPATDVVCADEDQRNLGPIVGQGEGVGDNLFQVIVGRRVLMRGINTGGAITAPQ